MPSRLALGAQRGGRRPAAVMGARPGSTAIRLRVEGVGHLWSPVIPLPSFPWEGKVAAQMVLAALAPNTGWVPMCRQFLVAGETIPGFILAGGEVAVTLLPEVPARDLAGGESPT